MREDRARTALGEEFFKRDTLTVAEELLGKFLMRRFENGEEVAFMITETEAYDGPDDKACHAYRGRTPRTEVMFGPAGHWYIYFVYGIHWMLNIVTGEVGYPAAVLLRGAGDISGPARLTKRLDITKAQNARLAVRETGLWIEDRGIVVPKRDIVRTPRIGVAYAGEWRDMPYRFLLKETAHPPAGGL